MTGTRATATIARTSSLTAIVAIGGIMKVHTSIVATAAGAAALVGAGAFILPAVAASTPTATHTLQFISVKKASVNFTASTGAQQDTDVNSAGKVVGYDMVYFKIVSRTTATLNITGTTNGGMLYSTGKFNLNTGAFSDGKVTGGTGAFKGATGTLTARSLNKAGTRTLVKITYHT